jgi:RluA family pseudouridine synthase
MQKLTCRVPPGKSSAGPPRLDEFLASSPEARALKLSRADARKLIVAGAVYVNGKRVRAPAHPLRGGEIVDAYWDTGRAGSSPTPEAEHFLPLRILYEDEALICFEKPAGLPTQPTVDASRPNLFDLAKRQLAETAASRKPVYLGMHHRLDRDTSGVVLFTRDTRFNAFVAEQFSRHKLSKTYIAVVHGQLREPKGQIESFLAEIGRTGKIARFGSVKSGGKKAITDFHVLSKLSENRTLIELKITTGRTHQIRVHLSELGHPIVGDTLYGSPVKFYNKLGRFLLHAHALSIEHPVTKNVLRVESPLPPEFRQ